MEKTLTFNGYWREINKSGIDLENSGIYCVYRSTYNSSEKTVSLKELIYIGESHNVKERIKSHEKLSDWKRHLKTGETLCYSCAPVDSSSRVRVEAALIYEHKPIVNSEYKNTFPFPTTTINNEGRCTYLKKRFICY